MNAEEAIEFLMAHQPMPPTHGAPESLLKKFDEVRKHFLANPDPRSVPLLIGAFGEGDGHGIYPMVEGTLRAHSENVVVPAVKQGLNSPHKSVRYWSAQIAANYPRDELVEPLVKLLDRGSVDERIAAVTALEAIGTSEAYQHLRNALSLNVEPPVREMLEQVLNEH